MMSDEMGILRSSSPWVYIFIITREGVGAMRDCGLTIFERGIVNRITERLQAVGNILLTRAVKHRTVRCEGACFH